MSSPVSPKEVMELLGISIEDLNRLLKMQVLVPHKDEGKGLHPFKPVIERDSVKQLLDSGWPANKAQILQ